MGSYSVKGKSGQGTVHQETVKKTGEVVEEHHEQELVGPVVVYGDSEPLTNVNVSLGARIGLPNYSDYRVNVSLTLPANLDPANGLGPGEPAGGVPGEAVERAFAYALEWCQKKITDLTGKKLVDA